MIFDDSVVKPKKYFNNLDGLRAYACLAVLLYHAHVPFSSYGRAGVQVFFVISGFLITDILLRLKSTTRGQRKTYFSVFYYRRVLRIFPAYYLLLFFVAILAIYYGGYLNDMIYYILYIQNRIIGFESNIAFMQMLGHTWTLAAEEQFYIVWPMIIRFLRRKYLVVLCIAGIISAIIWRYLFFNEYGITMASYSTLSHIDTLLGGALIALLYNSNLQFAKTLWISVVWLLIYLGFYFFVGEGHVLYDFTHLHTIGYVGKPFMIIAPFAVLLVHYLLVAKNILLKAIFQNAFIRFLGKISYGMYLYHLMIYVVIGELIRIPLASLFDWLPPHIFLLLYQLAKIVAVIGFAYLSYEYVEKKFLAHKDRYGVDPRE